MKASTSIAALLLDIEGTTTPIDFVFKVLFPYARAHVRDYLAAHLWSLEVRADIAGLLEENAQDTRAASASTSVEGPRPPLIEGPAELVSLEEVTAYVHWLMDRDRKSTPLKSIQGKIWEAGYHSGELTSLVFEDVPRAFERWREQGRSIHIYSSGSVLAQKLLFAGTQLGDLTPFIGRYFDTHMGAKKEAESYRRIAAALELKPAEVLFVSDVTDELEAAESAALQTLLCVRPGNHPQARAASYKAIQSFDEIA